MKFINEALFSKDAQTQILCSVDTHKEPQEELEALRKSCYIGDVISPIDEFWEVQELDFSHF
ncbi:MAG: hypothetical protein QM752_03530 [Gammaproteobacteria bacterium]